MRAISGSGLVRGHSRQRTGGRSTTRRAGSCPPCKGLVGLLKRRKVTVVNGFGTLTPEGAVAVDGQTLSGKAVIICCGSEQRSLPGLEVDGERIVTSDQASNSDAEILPERVAVIGGGVTGAEVASVYTDFGFRQRCWRRFHTACCRLARTATPLTSSRKLLPSAARTGPRGCCRGG
jgi:hypothetical protein